MRDADWAAIRREYVEGSISIRELAETHELPEKTVRNHASAEGWTRIRKEFRKKTGAKLADALSEEYFRKINVSAGALLRDLERARRDLTKTPVVTRDHWTDDDGVEHFKQSVTYERRGKVNAGELGKLIAGLDKLLEIGRKQTGRDAPEIRVTFGGEEELAD